MTQAGYKYLTNADIEDGKEFMQMYSELGAMGKMLVNAFMDGLMTGEAIARDNEKAGQEMKITYEERK